MMNRATPITSALKRKYSPFKKEDSTAVKESKQKLADETGVYVQTKTTTPGTPEKRKTVLYSDLPEEQREAARKYNMEKYGTLNPTAEGLTDNTVVTQKGTPGDSQTSEVQIKEAVKGEPQTPETYRRQVRSGKFAAGVEKRAAVDKARAEAKKQGLKGKEKRDYIRNARLDAKEIQKQKIQNLAGEVSTNVQKTAEAGLGVEGGEYYKGDRAKGQGEFTTAEQSTMGTRKKFFGGSGANLSSDLGVDTSLSGTIKEALKFSPAKFKSYGKTSPMKKLTDLSGDGKVTKKDVLIGRGVISKDGSPAKYGNKKSPYKMKGYGSKNY